MRTYLVQTVMMGVQTFYQKYITTHVGNIAMYTHSRHYFLGQLNMWE